MLHHFKKYLAFIVAFSALTITSIGVLFAMNGSDSFKVLSGEAVVLSFPKEVESIRFSKDNGFTIRTLEGGEWIDMTDQVSDYYPLRGYLIRNSGGDDLVIDVDYAMLSSVEQTLFQKDLPAGWNLVGIAYKDDHFGQVDAGDALGESLPYSQVIDFTGKDFPDNLISGEAIPMNQVNDDNINIISKSGLSTKKLFERLAYGVFVNVDSSISGTQKIDEPDYNTDIVTAEITIIEPQNHEVADGNDLSVTATIQTRGVEAGTVITSQINVYDMNNQLVDSCSSNIVIPEPIANDVVSSATFSCGVDDFTQSGLEYKFEVVADSNNIISEYDELNNIRVLVAVVGEPEYSDFLNDLLGIDGRTLEDVECSSNQIFANNSCDSCRTVTDQFTVGDTINPPQMTWTNSSIVDKVSYKEEQELPQIFGLNGSGWSSTQTPEWKYTSSYDDIYSGQQDGQVLTSGSSVVWIENTSNEVYQLNQLNETNSDIGLVVSKIKTHTISNGNVEVQAVDETQCVLYKNEEPLPETAEVSEILQSSSTSTVKGSTDVNMLEFEVEAGDDSTIAIYSLASIITDNSSDGFISNDEIFTVKLYKDSIIPANLLEEKSGTEITGSGSIIFGLSDTIVLTQGEVQKFIITADFTTNNSTVDSSSYQLTLHDLALEGSNNEVVLESGVPISGPNITITDSGKIVTLQFDDANQDNEFDKLTLAGESVVIASYDVRADNEEVDVENVTFTISGASGLNNTVVNASLLLNGVVIATNANSDISDTAIVFENMTNLIIPETTSELALQLNTANIGQDFVGVAQTGLQVSNVVLADASGVETGIPLMNGNIATQGGGSSKTLDIVSATITPAVVSNFGIGDNSADLQLIVDTGANVSSTGAFITTALRSVTLEASSVTSPGTVNIINIEGFVMGSGSIVSSGTHVINLWPADSIDNNNETYRITTTADATYRLAKDGIVYSINGSGSITTKLEDTLELGQYEDFN